MVEDFNSVQVDPKYGRLNDDLIRLLRDYDYRYFREDKPVPFKGLTIYPIAVRDYETFASCVGCLQLNKNEDPKGIRLSHLEYLLAKTDIESNMEGVIWRSRISKLVELCFHVQAGLRCPSCGTVIAYDDPVVQEYRNKILSFLQTKDAKQAPPEKLACPKCTNTDLTHVIDIVRDTETGKHSFTVNGVEITQKDFTALRQIILYQNFYDYVDESWVDPAVKKDHDEKVALEQRKYDIHATIEKKVVCLSITTNYKCDEIYNMSIRRFSLALATVDDLINYKITKQAVMSGFASLPKGKGIEHWIYKPNKDMYGDYQSTDEVAAAVAST